MDNIYDEFAASFIGKNVSLKNINFSITKLVYQDYNSLVYQINWKNEMYILKVDYEIGYDYDYKPNDPNTFSSI